MSYKLACISCVPVRSQWSQQWAGYYWPSSWYLVGVRHGNEQSVSSRALLTTFSGPSPAIARVSPSTNLKGRCCSDLLASSVSPGLVNAALCNLRLIDMFLLLVTPYFQVATGQLGDQSVVGWLRTWMSLIGLLGRQHTNLHLSNSYPWPQIPDWIYPLMVNPNLVKVMSEWAT